MANFMKMQNKYGETIYINRDFITDFRFVEKENKTVVCLPGYDCYAELVGDQTQKILDGWREL